MGDLRYTSGTLFIVKITQNNYKEIACPIHTSQFAVDALLIIKSFQS